MKLLFDQNLSPELAVEFGGDFPGSRHVRELGLASGKDSTIWEFAREHGFTIVSKDENFHHMSFLRGAPPKVVGIHTRNASTSAIGVLLRKNNARIVGFGLDSDASFLALP